MYLLINSFFPFVRWKQYLSKELHLIAGILVSWKRGYHVFRSNYTHVFQGQGKWYPRFHGETTFSPPIRVLKVLQHYWEGKVYSAPLVCITGTTYHDTVVWNFVYNIFIFIYLWIASSHFSVGNDLSQGSHTWSRAYLCRENVGTTYSAQTIPISSRG